MQLIPPRHIAREGPIKMSLEIGPCMGSRNGTPGSNKSLTAMSKNHLQRSAWQEGFLKTWLGKKLALEFAVDDDALAFPHPTPR